MGSQRRDRILGCKIQAKGEGELPPAPQRCFHESRPSQPSLEMEVGGLLGLALCLLNALQSDARRYGNIVEIPSEAALVRTRWDPINPRKGMQVKAARHILRVVIVRKGLFPAESHSQPRLSISFAYPVKTKEMLLVSSPTWLNPRFWTNAFSLEQGCSASGT